MDAKMGSRTPPPEDTPETPLRKRLKRFRAKTSRKTVFFVKRRRGATAEGG